MTKYELCVDRERWSILDEATQSIARIDGICLSEMGYDEARQMLKVLRGTESVKNASTKTAASIRRLARLSPYRMDAD
jgi:hypothetical protein